MRKFASALIIGIAAVLAISPTALAQGASMTTGEVTKVDQSAQRITIKHGPMPHLDMPAMTMAFRANSPAMLKDIKPGDKIRFEAQTVQGQIIVMKIEKTK